MSIVLNQIMIFLLMFIISTCLDPPQKVEKLMNYKWLPLSESKLSAIGKPRWPTSGLDCPRSTAHDEKWVVVCKQDWEEVYNK